MNIEKIGPLPPEKGKQKISDTQDPDSESFKDLMKIDKTKEAELDEQKKRRYTGVEEEKEENKLEEEPKPPASTDVYYYKEQEKKPLEQETKELGKQEKVKAPLSPSFYQEIAKKKIDKEEELLIKNLDTEIKKEIKEKIKKEKTALIMPKEKLLTEKKEELSKASSLKEKELTKEILLSKREESLKKAALSAPPSSLKKEATETKTTFFKKEEEKAPLSKKEILATEKELKEKIKEPVKETKKEQEEIPAAAFKTLELPPTIQAQAATITAEVDPLLHPEVAPVFEHIIGTIIHLEQKGISETQIILNNPQFANSRFFNTKITFEKYDIAPSSFNIRLTGSQEAVTIFNENLEGLYKALNTADLDFEIGRINAEYELQRPLFKRKDFSQDLNKDTGEYKE